MKNYSLKPMTKEECELEKKVRMKIGTDFKVYFPMRGFWGWLIKKFQEWSEKHNLDFREDD